MRQASLNVVLCGPQVVTVASDPDTPPRALEEALRLVSIPKRRFQIASTSYVQVQAVHVEVLEALNVVL